MTDIFFCPTPEEAMTEIRLGFLMACMARWEKEPGTVLKTIHPATKNYQVMRRVLADEKATTKIYICTDDDCLPDAEPFVQRAVEIMEKYPEYGILSLWPNNSTLNPWTPEPEEAAKICVGGTVHQNEEVMEHVSVGGIRFCRKGILKHWPRAHGKTYDSEHCAGLRAGGYRVGYFRSIYMNHLGRGYSTIWP